MKKKLYYFILTILFCIGNSLTGALSLKANVGVGAFDALFNTIAIVCNIKVGTMLILLCSFCLLLSVILLGKKTKITILRQMVLPLLGGYIVNFFYYQVLDFEITTYWLRLLTFVGSNIVSSFMVAGLMHCDLFFYPLEGLCNVLAEKTTKDFKFWRQLSDIICIVISVSLSLIFNIGFSIREGTLISALIFGPLVSIFMKIDKKLIK